MSHTFDAVRLLSQSGIVVVSVRRDDELTQETIAARSDMIAKQMFD